MHFVKGLAAGVLVLGPLAAAHADDPATNNMAAAAPVAPEAASNYATNADGTAQTAPITTGLRVFTCANSFHWFTPGIVKQMAESAGIHGEQIVGISRIGGSTAEQHWDIPDDQNAAKAALRTGRVDVLTLSCMFPPDAGIQKFTDLGLQFNPHLRVLLQDLWVPSDRLEWPYQGDIRRVDFDVATADSLRQLHEGYFQLMDAFVTMLDRRQKQPVVLAVPVGQALLELRDRIIAGQMPGIAKQSELFEDKIGHPSPPLKALASYCNFAVMYRHDPRGLPLPDVLAAPHNPKWDDKMNRALQDIAWDAVIHEPLSGVK